MKIAINAISIKEGGPAVVLEKLLEQFVRVGPEHEYHIAVSQRLGDPACFGHPSVVVRRFAWAEQGAASMALWYGAALARWLARDRFDVLFSQTNYLPATSPVPTALLVQHAGYFCPDFHVDRAPRRGGRLLWAATRSWTFRSLQAADHVTVQTQALAGLIVRRFPAVASRLTIIPHGPGFLDAPIARAEPTPATAGDARLAYVTKYGDQKNFGVLFRALRRLRDRRVGARLHLTISPEEPDGRRVAADAVAQGVADLVTWHGEMGRDDLRRLYERADVFVFPSVCESFGFPLVEALAFGLPVVAADTPGNQEICGDAARYFPPRDADGLAAVLEQWVRDPDERRVHARASAARAGRFDWRTAGERTLSWVLRAARAAA